MSGAPLRVVVIGAGLGGLCLAQGLRRAGIEVAVYERDPTAAVRQGYRIHLDVRGARALRECLPPALYELFEATRGQPSRAMSILRDDGGRLEEIYSTTFPDEEGEELIVAGWAVSRQTVRQVLLAGLDGVVHFGRELTHYESLDGDRVRARFADGSSVIGDVLVAADGVGSAVRRQLLPHATVVDTGVRWIMGKTLVDEQIRALLPRQALENFCMVTAGGYGMPLGLVHFTGHPGEAAQRLWPGLRLDDDHDYLMWAIHGTRERFTEIDDGFEDLDPPALRQIALRLTEGWHPSLRALVERAQPEPMSVVAMNAAAPVDHWPTTTVTLLGDAIHAMPPSRGSGGNTALRDASMLCRAIVAAASGERPLVEAIHDYEVEMLRYGFNAVRLSIQPLEIAATLGLPIPTGGGTPRHP